ncbi:MAG: M48 family metallopeptidase [Chitinophagaceae bacterium]|nr:M48 family metallopeptidase [Chitinophagaceae bacterium]MBL0129802.1 M48 family metallopeptidase [Chitinophagaceae bacterium]MBL0273331.1 M48 family metallopeptidase [Chitinophagaceae bacterium]
MLKRITSVFVLSFLLMACSQNVLTGKQQLTLLPESELQKMATGEYQKFLSTNKVVGSTYNRDAEMVIRVGQRITKAVNSYYAEKGMTDKLEGFNWEYNLVDDKAVNAWCMPGGKIVVYTGILPISQNEAALAAVMGHEVSHALLQHGNQRMSQGILQQLGGVALSVAVANKPAETQNLFMTAYGVGSTVGVMLPFSRKHELEADHYGLIWTAMAGYNPQEAIGLWERMEKAANGQKPPEFLSTHPTEGRRIDQLQKFMPEAMQYYKPLGNN